MYNPDVGRIVDEVAARIEAIEMMHEELAGYLAQLPEEVAYSAHRLLLQIEAKIDAGRMTEGTT